MGKGQETKMAILHEALELASLIGFNALSIGQLAERTGMSKSGLFAHFRSKDQLQLDTLDHARHLFVERVVRPAFCVEPGETRLRELFERWLAWETSTLSGGCVFVAAATEFDDQPGPLRAALVKSQHDWLDLISGVAHSAIQIGDLRPDLDPSRVAFELYGLMLAYHHAGRLMRDPRALELTRLGFESMLSSTRA